VTLSIPEAIELAHDSAEHSDEELTEALAIMRKHSQHRVMVEVLVKLARIEKLLKDVRR
jgi:hypothetical protein